jgi:hypothetical protein
VTVNRGHRKCVLLFFEIMFKYNEKIDEIFLSHKSFANRDIIKTKLIEVNRLWNKNKEKRAIELLCRDFEIPFKLYNLKYYIISRPFAGYNRKKKHIYISVYTRDIVTTIIHEIHHVYFYNKYANLLKTRYNFTDKQIGEFKEVMIFMINEREYSELINIKDNTYKDIIPLQKKMSKIWKKRKCFISFLDEAVILYQDLFC